MKKQFLLLALFLLFYGMKMSAQCTADAGADQTIVCGSSIKLNVETSWQVLNSNTTKKLSSVCFVTADIGYIVGESGLIIKTSNGGNNWSIQISNSTNSLNSVFFVNSETGYAVGDGGTILKTINGGTNWTKLTSGTTSNLFTVFLVDANIGYIGGDAGLVLKTINGGLNWIQPQQLPVTAHYPCMSVFFTSTNTGYAASYMGLHPKTIDGGLNWTGTEPVGTYGGIIGGALTSVYFQDTNTGFITELSSSTIYKSTDGGENWTKRTLGSNYYDLYSVHFSSVDTGYVVGSGGKIFRTVDKGETWKQQIVNTTNDLLSVDFPDANTGYAVGANGTILKLTKRNTYLWSPTTGLDNNTIANPTVTVTNNMTYTVTVTTPNGCTATDDVKVTVSPLTANAGTDKTIICGGITQINSVTTNYTGNGTLKYKWTPTTGLNNDTIANPIVKTTNDITYTLTVTTPNGCTAMDDVKVTVTPLIANAGIDKTIICGGTTQMNSVTTNYTGNGTLKYKWTPTTGLNNDTIANPTATVLSDITYTLTVTTPNGCRAVDDVKVTVTPLTANAGTDKTIICGGTTQMNSATTNYTGTGTLKYKWTPATGLNNDTIANPTVTLTNDITYTLTVTSPYGCTAKDEVLIKIIPMNKPQIGIVSVNNSNKNMVVWDKPVTTGIESYSVFRESNISDVYEKIGSVVYSDLSLFVDTLSAPDVKSNKYKISILDKSGQVSPLSDAHKTMHLSINKGQNNTWNLIWEPYNGFNTTTYNIYRGTNKTNLNFIDAVAGSSTQYSDILAPSGDVYYQLEVISPTLINPTKVTSIQNINDSESTTFTSYNSSRSNIASNLINGIEGLTEEHNINIYPNPVINELKIDFEGGSTFDILNLMGQVIYNGNLNKSAIVQTTSLTRGIYLIRFKIGKTFEYKKIIKE
ncbi:MAG: YCF48-related protein [Paludibacter sp.]|nr:YCF48-related protein [Paludibacter sp.]